MAQRTLRCPRRSPITPNIGARSVPMNVSEAKIVSIATDCDSTSTYHPRIRFSISNANEVERSAGHWKRKLRTWKGASAPGTLLTCNARLPHDLRPLGRFRLDEAPELG